MRIGRTGLGFRAVLPCPAELQRDGSLFPIPEESERQRFVKQEALADHVVLLEDKSALGGCSPEEAVDVGFYLVQP